MSLLLHLVATAAETGPSRRMLPACPTGARINAALDAAAPRPQESPEAYQARRRRKVRVLSHPHGCLDYTSCTGCPRAHEAMAAAAAESYYCLPEHAYHVIDLLGREGDDRPLPNACSIGRALTQLRATGDGEEHSDDAIDALTPRYKCDQVASCLHCPLGRGVMDDLLREMAETGMEGDLADTISDTYGRLV